MPSPAARLDELRTRYRDLARQILDLGLISPGSVVLRHTTCPHPGLPLPRRSASASWPLLAVDRYDSGKAITRRLTEPQARLYQEWIANRRRLAGTVSSTSSATRRQSR